MNETSNLPVKAKKLWTAPKLEVILLNSAANVGTPTQADGTTTRGS
jgi:hypothetical protein